MSRGHQESRDSGREESINHVRHLLQELPETFSGTTAIGPDDDLVITDDGPQPRVFKHEDQSLFECDDCGDSFELECVFYALTPDPIDLDTATEHNLLHRDGGPAVLWEDGGEEWFQFGQLHREDGPARIEQQPELGLVKFWYDHGEQHRDGDLPAVVAENGRSEWWSRGQLHRDGGAPAIIGAADPMGSRGFCWYQEGHLHRDDDLPAVIHADGSTEYYRHGQLHRDDGKPAWISASGNGVGWWINGLQRHPDPDQPACIQGDGTKTWYDSEGRIHRVGDAPAVLGPGRQCWYKHGVEHRENKPASIWNIFRGSQMATWTEDGVDRAELTVPDYAEDPTQDFDGDLCLTVFATKAGEMGFTLTTIKGVARYLATAGLELGEEIEFARHPKLWSELRKQIERAKELGAEAEYWWDAI